MKRYYSLIILFLYVTSIAQIPKGYYNNAKNKSTSGLKTALYQIISSGYHDVGYDGLYDVYRDSDNKPGNKVWDMYSTCTWYHGQKKCGNYKYVCDCYNREHTIPQSWFGRRSPMKSDAFHVIPTDGKVNGQRSSYPFGECKNGTTLTNGRGKKGSSSYPGYSGTVFEPDDEFKGDMARTYFYFATRYQNIMTTIGGDSFNGTTYPAFSSWSQSLFLKWHRQDPVSQKEIDRNNTIYDWQNNRNPFIDHPELAEYIWGNKMGENWSGTSSNPDTEEKDTSFSIYTRDKILYVISDKTDIDYTIYYTNGQIATKGELGTDKKVSLSHLPTGMYMVFLKNEENRAIRRFRLP